MSTTTQYPKKKKIHRGVPICPYVLKLVCLFLRKYISLGLTFKQMEYWYKMFYFLKTLKNHRICYIFPKHNLAIRNFILTRLRCFDCISEKKTLGAFFDAEILAIKQCAIFEAPKLRSSLTIAH